MGLGTQFTHLALRGRELHVVSSEQGVGRGEQPVSKVMEAIERGASGTSTTTYSQVVICANVEGSCFII